MQCHLTGVSSSKLLGTSLKPRPAGGSSAATRRPSATAATSASRAACTGGSAPSGSTMPSAGPASEGASSGARLAADSGGREFTRSTESIEEFPSGLSLMLAAPGSSKARVSTRSRRALPCSASRRCCPTIDGPEKQRAPALCSISEVGYKQSRVAKPPGRRVPRLCALSRQRDRFARGCSEQVNMLKG